MLPSPAPRFYVLGALLAAAGALVIALRGGRRELPPSRRRAIFAVGIAALVLGAAAVGTGIWIDTQYYGALNTTILRYRVSLTMNGTLPVRLLLPAPSDARFYAAMNMTNGSARLRLNHTTADTSVILTAYGNVSFEVRSAVPTASVNGSFTRVRFLDVGPEGPESNVTIEMMTIPFGGVSVLLALDASIGTGCTSRTLTLHSWIRPGVADYTAQTPTMVC